MEVPYHLLRVAALPADLCEALTERRLRRELLAENAAAYRASLEGPGSDAWPPPLPDEELPGRG
jgi:hypothetical protein